MQEVRFDRIESGVEIEEEDLEETRKDLKGLEWLDLSARRTKKQMPIACIH